MGKPKKAVLAAAEQSTTPPDTIASNQSLARVVKAEGSNLYSCALPNTKTVTVELADRFRNTIWIKRGGFVLVEAYADDERNSRAQGEIINVVRDEKVWRKMPYWCVLSRRISSVEYRLRLVRPKEFPKTPEYDDDVEDESTVGKMPPSESDDSD